MLSVVNVSISGKASIVTEKNDLEKAIRFLGERNPKFKERAEKGEIGDNVFFRVDPEEVKILDFSKGRGPDAVRSLSSRLENYY